MRRPGISTVATVAWPFWPAHRHRDIRKPLPQESRSGWSSTRPCGEKTRSERASLPPCRRGFTSTPAPAKSRAIWSLPAAPGRSLPALTCFAALVAQHAAAGSLRRWFPLWRPCSRYGLRDRRRLDRRGRKTRTGSFALIVGILVRTADHRTAVIVAILTLGTSGHGAGHCHHRPQPRRPQHMPLTFPRQARRSVANRPIPTASGSPYNNAPPEDQGHLGRGALPRW